MLESKITPITDEEIRWQLADRKPQSGTRKFGIWEWIRLFAVGGLIIVLFMADALSQREIYLLKHGCSYVEN